MFDFVVVTSFNRMSFKYFFFFLLHESVVVLVLCIVLCVYQWIFMKDPFFVSVMFSFGWPVILGKNTWHNFDLYIFQTLAHMHTHRINALANFIIYSESSLSSFSSSSSSNSGIGKRRMAATPVSCANSENNQKKKVRID